MTGVVPRLGAVTTDESFPLEYGSALDHARIAYSDVGPAHGPVTVVMGGISAGRHVVTPPAHDADGWWGSVVGVGRALDTTARRVISFDYLSGPGESCALGTGTSVATHDQARALALVLDDLDIERVDLVGASYGGMVALVFAALFPARARRLVVISAAHRSHPMATALRSLQRDIATLGSMSGQADRGLALARGLAMTTYRTAEEFQLRFSGTPKWTEGRPRFQVQDYLDHHGSHFGERFSVGSFRCLSESIDLHRVAPETITAPTTVVSVDSDRLVPGWLAAELAGRLSGPCTTIRIASHYGHDAFLKEPDQMGRVVTGALDGPLGGVQ